MKCGLLLQTMISIGIVAGNPTLMINAYFFIF